MPKEIVSCACGCGAQFERLDSKNRPRRYVSGHNPPAINPTLKETISCRFCAKQFTAYKTLHRSFCSRSCKARWIGQKLSNDLEYKERQRQLIKAKGNRPPEHKGENHWNWKGGISKQSRGEDYQYVQWRKDVFVRDDYTCQICKVRGGKLNAHHIKPWVDFPELRYELSNGVCWCRNCHMGFHGLLKGQRKNKNALSKREAA